MQSIFPFEKNRYFPRKRMRSADFSRELQYMDHKFQLLHRWTFGAGTAVGLGVQRLDSESLLVLPGMAVDDWGRCILVDEPAVCRIRTLPGFDQLQGETALLWLSYREEPKEPVFVAGEEGEHSEFTVAAERFTFSLSGCSVPAPDAADQVLYSRQILYEDETLRVRQVVPQVISNQRPAVIRLIVDNLTPEPVSARIRYQPQLPGFHMEDGTKGLCLDRTLDLPGGSCTLELTVVPDTTAQSAALTLPEGGLVLQVHGSDLSSPSSFREELTLTSGDPLEILAQRLYALPLQDLWGGEDERGVPIAGVRFLRYDEGFLLDDVLPLAPQRRSRLPDLERRLQDCGHFFPAPAQVPPVSPQEEAPSPAPDPPQRHMTTGVVTLQAGLHPQEGKILCSHEIAHELGPGTVYVDFGIENVYPAVNMDRNSTDLLLGDASLFVQAGGSYPCRFDKGVRLHPDKGTFELALRLNGKLYQANLRLRWFAWRPQESIPQPASKGALIRLEPDVIYAKPGDTIHFAPVFDGDGLPCEFFVPEKRAGLITRDGLYTAPDREGLYQVCAQIQARPETKVSAFVIVRAQEEGSPHAPSL